MREASILLLVTLVAMLSAGDREGRTQIAAEGPPQPSGKPKAAAARQDVIYMCPMDKDIRSNGPGTCPRCGMKLVADIPDPVEYHMDVTVTPQAPRPGGMAHLTFEVRDPWKGNPVTKFTLVHERLFHAFIVSRDLQFFVHDHPTWVNDSFQYDVALPKPGLYRVLGDFYPEGATPQLAAQTIFVVGDEAASAPLTRDYSPKSAQNLEVHLTTVPADPTAGSPTQLRLSLTPADGLEKYLGAWAHMLAASDDLIDMMHTHPFLADGGPNMEFRLVFPRARIYRVWVQVQRKGIVNTAHFDIPVGAEMPNPPGTT